MRDFDTWNTAKKNTDADTPRLYTVRDIWWCKLGTNIGAEEDGTGTHFDRPVVVLCGLSKTTCIVVPLTTATHEHAMRPSVGLVDGKPARAILSQVRVVGTKRFVRKVAVLPKDVFEDIRKRFKDML